MHVMVESMQINVLCSEFNSQSKMPLLFRLGKKKSSVGSSDKVCDSRNFRELSNQSVSQSYRLR